MEPDNNTISARVRFAPSPTGSVHIGSLRTALYDYLIAKKSKGKFILRIEDTDQKRFVPNAVEKVIAALKWAGIEPDEGVMDEMQIGKIPVGIKVGKAEKYNGIYNAGQYGPYIQSERLAIYKQHVDQLIQNGHAYYCFCTSERLETMRQHQLAEGKISMYDRCCRNIPIEEAKNRIANGEKYVIRMKIPDNENIQVDDLIFGKLSFPSNAIDDQVLLKADGFPTYHLAVVVDDHLMGITDITRGDEWLPSTPKHVLLYRFFGWPVPRIAHFPTILNQNRKKLSKREGDVSVDDFIKKGYLPEAMVNFLALLGWNPKTEQEIFTLTELVEKFDEKAIHKAGAIFDIRKLDWINSYYIKQKTDEQLLDLCLPYLNQYLEDHNLEANQDFLGKIVQVEKERMKKLADITENIGFYFQMPDFNPTLLIWKNNSIEETKKALEKALSVIMAIENKNFNTELIQTRLLEAAGDKRGDLLWPTRVALSGKDKSPSPFEIAWVIGKDETKKRLEDAINKLSAGN